MSLPNLRPLDTDSQSDGLVVEVPRFDSGPYPPHTAVWEPLQPEVNRPGDLPIFCPEVLLRALAGDEARFRQQHPADWVERCWLLLGAIVRDPAHCLWGTVERIIPGTTVNATAASFELAPETWSNVSRAMAITGEILLGWIHSHSLVFLKRTRSAVLKQVQTLDSSNRGSESHNSLGGITSGLFLSQEDIESAYKRGFSAPYQITCILDSDACLMGEDARLHELFAVYGWLEGFLLQRSVHVLKSTHW